MHGLAGFATHFSVSPLHRARSQGSLRDAVPRFESQPSCVALPPVDAPAAGSTTSTPLSPSRAPFRFGSTAGSAANAASSGRLVEADDEQSERGSLDDFMPGGGETHFRDAFTSPTSRGATRSSGPVFPRAVRTFPVSEPRLDYSREAVLGTVSATARVAAKMRS
jgi:hypothetical protein